MPRKRILLDMDPGVDDALAIVLALNSRELDVQAITTVCGNVEVSKTTRNALTVLENFGWTNIPVAKGLKKPLFRNLEPARAVHGKDGLGDSNFPKPKLKIAEEHAVDLIRTMAETSKKRDLTIVATGPLTNIAAALLREPGLVTRLREIILMGGAYGTTPFGHGNVTASAEFNIYTDPEAAKIVFESRIPITAVGLDVTTDPTALLTSKHLARISRKRTAGARFVSKITKRLFESYRYVALHDPMAVAVTIDRSLVETKPLRVDVETAGHLTRGITIADKRIHPDGNIEVSPNADVCVRVNGSRFLKIFTDRVVNL